MNLNRNCKKFYLIFWPNSSRKKILLSEKISKYLKEIYFVLGGIRNLNVPRNGRVRLQCKGRREIRVLKAAFGAGRCRTPHAHCVLSQLCNGNKSCVYCLPIHRRNVDSPCNTRRARLELQYECIRRPGKFYYNSCCLTDIYQDTSAEIDWMYTNEWCMREQGKEGEERGKKEGRIDREDRDML